MADASALSSASLVFGPLPSRRLGRSLGVNTIAHKVCSYSCACCQVGRTRCFEIAWRSFFTPDRFFASVRDRVGSICEQGGHIDYVRIVANGEPSLDVDLGRSTRLMKTLGVPLAVITNASLLHRSGNILESVRVFMAEQRGPFATETVLVAGANDGDEEPDALAAFLVRLRPRTAYLAIPTRPLADARFRPASPRALTRAHQLMAAANQRVELLCRSEEAGFSSSGDAAADRLAITAVHPMRTAAVQQLLAHANADWTVVRDLLADGRLTEMPYSGETYYLRSFMQRRRTDTRADQGG